MDILQVKSDKLFHDLINENEMDTIVMKILKCEYSHYVDLIIVYQEYEIILELNNNFLGNIIRNIVYGMTRIVGFYKEIKSKNKKEYKDKYYKDKLKVILINLNWINRKSVKYKESYIDKLYGFIGSKNNKNIFYKVISITLD